MKAESWKKVLDELVRNRHTELEILVLHGHVSRQPLPNLERSRNWEVRLNIKEIKHHVLNATFGRRSASCFFSF